MGDQSGQPGVKGTWARGRRELGLTVEGRGDQVLERHCEGVGRVWNNQWGDQLSGSCGRERVWGTQGDTAWREEKGWSHGRKRHPKPGRGWGGVGIRGNQNLA